MIEKMLKNFRNAVLCGIAVAIVAMSCAGTALAQNGSFLVAGTNATGVAFCGTTPSTIGPPAYSLTLSTSDNFNSAWSTSVNQPWITVVPTSGGTTPQSLFVETNGNASSLPAGVSTGTITINPGAGSNESAATITVTVNISSSGCGSSTGNLTLSANSLVFTSASNTQPPAQSLSITNNTGSTITLNGTAASNTGFLSLTALSSTTIANGQFVTYQVNASNVGLTAGVSYTGTLNFATSAGPSAQATVPVTFNYGTAGSGGLIPDQASLIFSPAANTQPLAQTINIKNNTTSTVTINGTVALGTFLTVGATSATTVGPGNSVSFQVNANTTGLTAGNSFSGSLTFTDGVGDSLSVPVTLNYGTGATSNGVLSTNQSSLTASSALGVNPPILNVNVANNSQSTIVLNASATTTTGQGWLSAAPSSQSVAGNNIGSVAVTINTAPLGNVAGTYTGTVTLTANSSTVSAQTVLGTLTIPVTFTYGGSSGGGSLSVNPGSFTASITFGGQSTSQTLSVTNNSTSNITYNIGSTGAGLSLSASGQQTIFPSQTLQYTVSFNPTGLTAGNYTGNITITPVVGTFTTITIPTTLCYGTSGTCQAGGSTTLTGSPNPMTFTIPAGSLTPVNQNLAVTSSVGSNTVTAFASTTSAAWLSVSPGSAVAGTTAANFTVTVTPSLLPTSGVGIGSITLIPATGTNLVVPVNVNTGSGGLTISPSQLSFAYQTGTANPTPQNLTISSAAATGFTVSATTSTGANWLVVSPQSGSTTGSGAGTSITVSINPTGLAATTYSGQIVITNSSTSVTTTIPVSLLVSTLPILSFSNSGTTFNYQFGSTTLPTQQTVQVTSSGTALAFSTNVIQGTGGNFLFATPSNGTTPQTLTLSLNSAALSQLAPGTYSANIQVLSNAAGNSPVTYPVSLNVTNNTVLNASQSSLNFNYEIGQSQPNPQTLNISSSGQPLTFSASAASANCGSFLSATANNSTTPGIVTVSVNVNGLVAGLCTGTVSVSSAGAGNSPLNIPVNLYVSNSALLNVSPGAINVITQLNNSPQNQNISLTSTDSTILSYSVSLAPGGNSFLLVSATSGTTPSNLTVGFSTTGLTAGTYTSNLTITATGPSSSTVANSPVTVPITVVVTSNATASTTPPSLTFAQIFNGSAPPSQNLQVNSTTAGLTFSATASTFNGGNWLSVSPSGGTTSGNVTVSANGSSLNSGTYTGTITIAIPGAANSPLLVPVTLTVGAAQSLALSTTNLSFSYASGGTTPQPQSASLSSTGGNVSFTATAAGTPLFASVSPTNGNTPATLTVSLNATVLATLSAGTYTNQITIASSGLTPLTLTVTLTVQSAPAPTISTIVNGASLQPGAVSPGEVVTILGTNLGPATGVLYSTGSDGKMSTNTGGTTVTFDGVLAPEIFVQGSQINAIVPYEIGGRVNTNVVVTRGGQSSTSLQQVVTGTSPAIFSLSQNGNGQGAILNSNSSVNGPGNAATRGSVVQIFATGEGLLVPGAATGSFTPSSPPFAKPTANVSVTIGGAPAIVTYAGEAPGLVSGVLQVNAVVPQSVGSGPQTVVLTVGANSNNTQQITVQVQ